ncbi:MAG TPA: hypothetical protein VGW11_08015 [Solirubrobacteraceae bacterium]|nr:hypothetical protein [Solirubrobacteraceae bacterium]
MSAPKPPIARHRARVEAALRIAGPVLDLVLATGDRLSRTLVRTESDDAPAPVAGGRSRGIGPGPQGSD